MINEFKIKINKGYIMLKNKNRFIVLLLALLVLTGSAGAVTLIDPSDG